MEDTGPSLGTYVETRFNLLNEQIAAAAEATKAAINAADVRYQQRYESTQKSLELAFAGQKSAVDAAFAAQKEAINAALAAADRAVSKAEAASEKRFEGVNEFRSTLSDQQRTLMPRGESEARFAALAEKIAVLESFRTETLSRGTGTKEGYGWAIAIIGVILTILTIISAAIMLISRLRP